MRGRLAVLALVLVALLAVVACAVTASDAGPASPCGSLYPGLRVEGACPGELRVVIDGRDVPPTPRQVDAAGAVILPWPAWARAGMPASAGYGTGVRTAFSAEPYACQVVAVTCP